MLDSSINRPFSTTTFSSPSTYRSLKLPHSFDRSSVASPNQFSHFEEWKRQHAEWFRKKPGSQPQTVHASSCLSIPRNNEPIMKEEVRRTHSAGTIRDLIPKEDFAESKEHDLDARIHMTDIIE